MLALLPIPLLVWGLDELWRAHRRGGARAQYSSEVGIGAGSDVEGAPARDAECVSKEVTAHAHETGHEERCGTADDVGGL